MRILKDFCLDEFNMAIFGLGFESRAVTAAKKYREKSQCNLALGYDVNTDKFSYQKNKRFFQKKKTDVFEGTDNRVLEYLSEILRRLPDGRLHILLDITVMSRHRLACIMCMLVDNLPPGSTLSVTYSLSKFIPPPIEPTPIKHLCEISEDLCGSIGDPSKPSSVIFGLGYEPGKAAGVLNFLESSYAYAFIPNSPVEDFKAQVKINNLDFFESVPKDNIFEYNVCSPYTTYLDLRSLIISLSEFSRPLLIPLGPKILASLSVLLGKELSPNLPVWRVSSDLLETPIDRSASGIEIKYSIQI